MSKLADARISQLTTERDTHLARAKNLESKGLTLSAHTAVKAAAAVDYRLQVLKRKLVALDYARRNVPTPPTDADVIGNAVGHAVRAALSDARQQGLL